MSCSVKDCDKEVSVSGRCVKHRVIFDVGDEVVVTRTQKVHRVATATPKSPSSSYVLDNGIAYWEFELERVQP